MPSQFIGKVKSGKGKEYKVFWNPQDRRVSVGWGGRTGIGKASSASQAANMAEVWLRNK